MKAIIAAVLFLAAQTWAGEQILWSPRNAGLPEFLWTPFPFYTDPSETASVRWQQVHSVLDFAALGHGRAYITEIALVGFPLEGDVLQRIQINLSTTTREPDSLSPVFADNVGANDTVVFGPGPLQFPALPGNPLRIVLSRPFLYDGSRGNLLVDIRNFAPGPVWLAGDGFAAVFREGDTVSRVGAADVNATGGFPHTAALVMGFYYEPVPEPGVTVLLAIGAGVFGACGLWHTRRAPHAKGQTEDYR